MNYSALTEDHAGVSADVSRNEWRGGALLSGLAITLLIFDAAIKVVRVPLATDAHIQLGYAPSVVFPIGLLEVALLILYVVPRTSVLGAILWTGYLGGAVATHVRIGNPLFTHALFPIYVAVFLWAGLWLRDRRVRALVR
jgi:hypothetical protein